MKQVLLGCIILCICASCDKDDETDNESCIISYVYNDIEYNITMQKKSDGNFEPTSKMNKNLANVINSSDAYFLLDPFDYNRFYVFKNERDAASTRIKLEKELESQQNNTNKNGSHSLLDKNKDSCGWLYAYQDINFQNKELISQPISQTYCDMYDRIKDSLLWYGGIDNFELKGINDKISSIRICKNTSIEPADCGRFVLTLCKDKNYKGKCIAIICKNNKDFGNEIDGLPNLHIIVMEEKKLKKNWEYWGDQISSCYFYYETPK